MITWKFVRLKKEGKGRFLHQLADAYFKLTHETEWAVWLEVISLLRQHHISRHTAIWLHLLGWTENFSSALQSPETRKCTGWTENDIISVFKFLSVCVCYLVYPEGDVSKASVLSGIFHQLPVHGPELVKLICGNTRTSSWFTFEIILFKQSACMAACVQ